MKKSHLLLITAAFIFAACGNEEKIELFNGENLDNWTIFLPDSIETESVFRVQNEKIYIGGIPNAYIRTKEEFSSYKLHLEWRWLEEPKNSGVLLHVSGEDMIWPNCIEAQLMAGKAGDFVLIGKDVGLSVNDSAYFISSEEARYAVAPKFEESSENAAGEWNTYEISVDGDNIKLLVNDVLQNECTATSKTKGNICLQSEGGPMEFRNIYILPL
jgi:hypothetical protein